MRYEVDFGVSLFVAGSLYLVILACHFWRQVQHLVTLYSKRCWCIKVVWCKSVWV